MQERRREAKSVVLETLTVQCEVLETSTVQCAGNATNAFKPEGTWYPQISAGR